MDNPNLVEFEIRTIPTPNFRTNWYTLSTLNAALMDQPFPVELRSLYSPNEIEGELIEFTITPEFHTFKKAEKADSAVLAEMAGKAAACAGMEDWIRLLEEECRQAEQLWRRSPCLRSC